MIKPHKYGIGPLTMALGIINASFGFKFAIAGAFNLVYVPIVIAVVILLSISIGVKQFFMGRRKKNSNGPMGFGEAGSNPAYGSNQAYGNAPYDAPGPYNPPTAPYGGGYDSTRSDIALTNMGQPPSYSQQPAKPREMI
jgi:hypothetical protein